MPEKHKSKRAALIRLACAVAAVAVIPLLAWNGFVQQLNASWSDILLGLVPPARSSAVNDITLVTIDDRTASRLGRLPLNRARLAEAIERIAEHKPRVIVVDLLLADPSDPSSDRRLAEALRRHSDTILGVALEGDPSAKPRWILPLMDFDAAHAGHVHAAPDPDGVVRSVLLAKSGAGRRFWALGLEAARLWFEADGIVETRETLQAGPARIPASEAQERQMPIRFLASEGAFRRVSIVDIVDGRAAPELVRGKIVLIGVTAQGSGDRFATPVFSGLGMSGVEIHANIIRAILDGDFLRHPGVTFEAALYLGIVISVLLAVRFFRGWSMALALAALAAGIGLITWISLTAYSILLPPGSLLAVFLFAASIAGAAQNSLLSNTLRKTEQRQEEYSFRLQAIAHEIATPLTAIQGSSELIAIPALSEQKRIEVAGLIYKESQRLNSILQTFLNVERMASGKLQIRKEAVDMQSLCEEVAGAARLYGARKRISVETEAPLLSMQADGDLLSFAVYNLLTNAIKYSPNGSRVKVTAAVQDGEVRIAVTDQGYGVAEADQERIFERFFRLNRDKKGPEKGFGIGLALVREIAVRHGGRVSVESRPNGGSRFEIAIPKE